MEFPKEKVYYEDDKGILYNGDVLEILKKLPDESVDCVVTSPPYWALRDYKIRGQLGLESSFDEYLEKLWKIFDEVYRVLKPTGTCWVNLGDTMKQKSLCLIPERFAIGMIERGWILRNEIIWHKPNAMPESVKDRFTIDFEKIFFFVKNKKYYFKQVLEPYKSTPHAGFIGKKSDDKHVQFRYATEQDFYGGRGRNKRTVWSISTKPFKGAHFAVYPEELCEIPIRAGCPEEVCKKCGLPRERIYERVEKRGKEKGVTGKYRMASNSVDSAGGRKHYYTVERKYVIPKSMQVAFAKWLKKQIGKDKAILDKYFERTKWEHWLRTDLNGQSLPSPEDYTKLKSIYNLSDEWDKWLLETVHTVVDDSGNSLRECGYSEYCSCGNNEWDKGVVLDPFMGSGTTAVVAEKLNRRWIGIELNPKYCEIAKKRILGVHNEKSND